MQRKTDNFNKFFNKKRNSAVKEAFKQEKKAAKKERKEAIERHFEERRKARGFGQDAPPAGRPPRTAPESSGNKGSRPSSGPSPTGRNQKGGIPKGTQPAPDGKARKSAPQGAVPDPGFKKSRGPHPATVSPTPAASHDPNLIALNKYIAHGGICSRRDAAELIRLGKVQVNGQTVTEPGTKVSLSALVKANGKKVTISRNFVYILLNKPKDYITTTDDPQGRRTVLDLIRQATSERVFPVGRLDRNTSGVLLLTNDGDLAQKLAHPKHEIKKIYHVTLDKPLTKTDFDKIIGPGIELEDGLASVDVLAYADPKDKTQIGLEIHSGRNRIVRRIFEHLGYDVRGLDRVTYAGLTKKNVQRGKWRLLTEKEIRILKYLNSSVKGSPRKSSFQEKAILDEKVDALLNDTPSGKSRSKAAPPKDRSADRKASAPARRGKPNPAKDDTPEDFVPARKAIPPRKAEARRPSAHGKAAPRKGAGPDRKASHDTEHRRPSPRGAKARTASPGVSPRNAGGRKASAPASRQPKGRNTR